MAPKSQKSDRIDKADPRQPHIILRTLPSFSFSTPTESVNVHFSLHATRTPQDKLRLMATPYPESTTTRRTFGDSSSTSSVGDHISADRVSLTSELSVPESIVRRIDALERSSREHSTKLDATNRKLDATNRELDSTNRELKELKQQVQKNDDHLQRLDNTVQNLCGTVGELKINVSDLDKKMSEMSKKMDEVLAYLTMTGQRPNVNVPSLAAPTPPDNSSGMNATTSPPTAHLNPLITISPPPASPAGPASPSSPSSPAALTPGQPFPYTHATASAPDISEHTRFRPQNYGGRALQAKSGFTWLAGGISQMHRELRQFVNTPLNVPGRGKGKAKGKAKEETESAPSVAGSATTAAPQAEQPVAGPSTAPSTLRHVGQPIIDPSTLNETML
ncbi:hypothetical protein C8Q73DRAFT_787260 [Cubamyces lactineus]|nr:hypothetical protein C8Q73DRAFT_787260 [Cubamyces lactineus]